MTWALKRQILYIIVLILFLLGAGFLISRPILNKAPSCVDNKQNGDETGIDCGGSCARACLAETDKISVLWSRSFKVVAGRYNAVAYLENHNQNTAVDKIKYRFRFADANNVYIGKREGTTSVPPYGKFVIFEPAIDVGNSIPVYTSLEFTSVPNWIKVSEDKVNELHILVSNISLSGENFAPFLSATIKNDSFFIVPDIRVAAILYDANHNAVSASLTYIDKLISGETKDITFTWPEPFDRKVIAKEIIPMYNVFSVKLK